MLKYRSNLTTLLDSLFENFSNQNARFRSGVSIHPSHQNERTRQMIDLLILIES